MMVMMVMLMMMTTIGAHVDDVKVLFLTGFVSRSTMITMMMMMMMMMMMAGILMMFMGMVGEVEVS